VLRLIVRGLEVEVVKGCECRVKDFLLIVECRVTGLWLNAGLRV
jgi:hypothetical protein